jgi:uncharacterized protein (DUF488 family)
VNSLFTIGFTQKGAKKFFDLLAASSVKKLIDVRLNNTGQLSGFAKKDDLSYFLKRICAIEYVHMPSLAPTADILSAYKKKTMSWEEYEKRFVDLIHVRKIERELTVTDAESSCLLCSEHKPHKCHRRLVAEYLNDQWGTRLTVKHLV